MKLPGLKTIFIAVLLWNNQGLFAQCSGPGSIRYFGNADTQSLHSVEITSDGGFIAAGLTQNGTVGGSDMVVMKFDPDQELAWSICLGTAGDEGAFSTQIREIDSGEYFFSCYTEHGGSAASLLFGVLDGNGNILWSKVLDSLFSDHGDSFEDVIKLSSGKILCAGTSDSYTNGNSDALLMQIDTSGNIDFFKYMGGDGQNHIDKILEKQNGNIILVGSDETYADSNNDNGMVLELDPGLNVVNSYVLSGAGTKYFFGAALDFNDNVYIGGFQSIGGDEDIVVLKLDPNFSINWQNTYDAGGDERGLDVQVVDDSNVVVTGTWNNGTSKTIVLRTDLDGYFIGCNNIGIDESNEISTWAQSTAIHPSEGIIIVGSASIIDNEMDCMVCKTNSCFDTACETAVDIELLDLNLSAISFEWAWGDIPMPQNIQVLTEEIQFNSNVACSVFDNCPVIEQMYVITTPCSGANVSFGASLLESAGFQTWSWYIGDFLVGIDSVGVISIDQPGDYEFVLIVSNPRIGCNDTMTTDAIITIAPEILALGDTAVCEDSDLSWIAELVDDTTIVSWSWVLEGDEISTSEIASYNFQDPGEFELEIIATSTITQCADTTSLLVSVFDAPDSTITVDGMELTASPGLTYQWYHNEEPIPGEIYQTFTPGVEIMNDGGFWCLVTGESGCETESEWIFFLGDSNLEPGSFTLFPNPMVDVSSLIFPAGIWNVRIFDSRGRLVGEWEEVQYQLFIDRKAMSPGIYFINISNLVNQHSNLKLTVR